MSWIDWTIMAVPMAVVCYIAWVTNKYVRGVSDFLAAGRHAGRYLVCTASGMASMGVISVVAACEQNYHAGFAISWWGMLGIPVGLIMTLTGFVTYRYRETRAMTMPEFFEMRYSRRFRIFAGVLAAVSGILNYGIFPAVAGRFFVYFCGLPEQTPLPFAAGATVPTFALAMIVFLGAALVFVLMGGQLTIMVTDCVQGLFSYAMYLVVAIALLYIFSWHQISGTLLSAPPNQSLVNPFRTSEVKDFNIWFKLIGIFAGIYTAGAWQGTAGFNCSAASAHEQKMGGILGSWRGLVFEVMQTLLAICALTFMTSHAFAPGAAAVNAKLATIHSTATVSGPYLQEQMRVPVALAHFLPVGIKGIFAALMFFLACTNDVSYLHSWGSIVAQDMILPFRKKALTPKSHLLLLRGCITGVTIFAFCWSMLFPQTQYIYMYFAVTGAIFLGGAGSVIIGGLYWKRATTAGAWAAMIVGCSTAVGGEVLSIEWFRLLPHLIHWFPAYESYLHAPGSTDFPINGQYVNAMSMGLAILSFVVISLATCRQPFDLGKMLHRGKWAVDSAGNSAPAPEPPPRTWRALLGIDEHFTFGDKILSITLFWYSMAWFGVFVVISIWNLISIWPDTRWVDYWFYTGILWPIVLGTITSVWFTIGGIRDLRVLFQRLRHAHANVNDDGEALHETIPPSETIETDNSALLEL
jgi:SSS family solute:Na+ symporter